MPNASLAGGRRDLLRAVTSPNRPPVVSKRPAFIDGGSSTVWWPAKLHGRSGSRAGDASRSGALIGRQYNYSARSGSSHGREAFARDHHGILSRDENRHAPQTVPRSRSRLTDPRTSRVLRCAERPQPGYIVSSQGWTLALARQSVRSTSAATISSAGRFLHDLSRQPGPREPRRSLASSAFSDRVPTSTARSWPCAGTF